MFHAKMDLKLYLVMATIRRSGRPRSSTSTISPPASRAKDNKAESRASGLYITRPNTEEIDATFSAPEAATIRNTANTCGVPQTT